MALVDGTGFYSLAHVIAFSPRDAHGVQMQFGTVSIVVTALAASIAGISMLFHLDLAKIAAYLGTGSFLLLILLGTIEYRRRSKRFSKR